MFCWEGGGANGAFYLIGSNLFPKFNWSLETGSPNLNGSSIFYGGTFEAKFDFIGAASVYLRLFGGGAWFGLLIINGDGSEFLLTYSPEGPCLYFNSGGNYFGIGTPSFAFFISCIAIKNIYFVNVSSPWGLESSHIASQACRGSFALIKIFYISSSETFPELLLSKLLKIF